MKRAPRGSRRRFLKLMAAGSAVLLAGAPATSAPARRARTAKHKSERTAGEGPRSRSVQVEIDKQKTYLAKTLKTIHEYPLPPGSEMAFAFRPLKAVRGPKRAAPRSGRTG